MTNLMKENRTKEFRIAKGKSKLKRKIKIMYYSGWYSFETYDYNNDRKKGYADFLREVLLGEKHTWMRNQNTPCSCYMCSGCYKYVRETNTNTNYLIKKYGNN